MVPFAVADAVRNSRPVNYIRDTGRRNERGGQGKDHINVPSVPGILRVRVRSLCTRGYVTGIKNTPILLLCVASLILSFTSSHVSSQESLQ